MRHQDFDGVIAEWKTCTTTLGRQVKIVTRAGVTQGTAVDVDEGGALMVRTTDGTLKKVIYGDCFHDT